MEDFLYRGVIRSAKVRFVYSVTSNLVNESITTHNCDPLAAHILARALTSGALTIPLLNQDERYTLKWEYNGALQSVIIDVGGDGTLRGCMKPLQLTGMVNSEADIYGPDGCISVIQSKDGNTLNSGTVEAGLLDVVDDLGYFFSLSNQVETGMVSMVGFQADPKEPVSLSQGVMLQAMPDCDLEEFDRLRHNLNSPECRNLIAQKPENDNYFEEILKVIMQKDIDPDDIKITAGNTPVYKCTCNKDKLIQVMKTLTPHELGEQDEFSVQCQFCSKTYNIKRNEIV